MKEPRSLPWLFSPQANTWCLYSLVFLCLKTRYVLSLVSMVLRDRQKVCWLSRFSVFCYNPVDGIGSDSSLRYICHLAYISLF